MATTAVQGVSSDFVKRSTEAVALEWLGKAEFTVTSEVTAILMQLRVYDYYVQTSVPYWRIAQSNLDILQYHFEELVSAMKKVTHEIHNPSK